MESEEEEIAMAIGVGGLGFSALLAWEEEGVCLEEEPIRGEIK